MIFSNGDYVSINPSVTSVDIEKGSLIAEILDSFFDEVNQEVCYEVNVGVGCGLGVFRAEYSESDLIKFKKGC